MSTLSTLARRVLPSSLVGAVRRARRAISDSPRVAERRRRAVESTVHPRALEGAEGEARHLLLAASGNHNTGDQAMLEAYLAAVHGPVTVVVERGASYVLPERDAPVDVVALPGLLTGSTREFLGAVEGFARLADRHHTFSIVGADVIDGGYHRRSAVTSWAMAGALAGAGRDVRVLGFSWGAKVDRAVVHAARRAADAGVVSYVRDPHSLRRFSADGIANAVDAADTVFTLDVADESQADGALASGRALVNISGLIRSRMGLVDEHVALVDGLVERGYAVTLLAHVNNPSASDSDAIREVVEALPASTRSALTVVTELQRPREVARLASGCDVVVTGRMHLAILATNAGTPAMVLSTQGKVSGLMERLGLPDWSFEPAPGMAELILRACDDYAARRVEVRAQLRQSVAELRRLAWRNYDGLRDQ